MLIINNKKYFYVDEPVNEIDIGSYIYTRYNKYHIADCLNDIVGRYTKLFKVIDIQHTYNGIEYTLLRGTIFYDLDTYKRIFQRADYGSEPNPISAQVL